MQSLKNKLIILFFKLLYILIKRIISRVNNYNYYVGFSFDDEKIIKEHHYTALIEAQNIIVKSR